MQPSTLPSSTGSLAMYLAEINKYPLLTVDEEQRLARLYAKSGDLDAAHKLVTSTCASSSRSPTSTAATASRWPT
jgi:RNA polymerase sigma-32 factor